MSELARELLYQFRGDAYAYGEDALREISRYAAELSWRGYRNTLVVRGASAPSRQIAAVVTKQLRESDIEFTLMGEIAGAAPGAPLADVVRLAESLRVSAPHLIIVAGGSSVIDAVKGANVLATYGGALADYAGENRVTRRAFASGRTLIPTLAIQTMAGAAAHLSRCIYLDAAPRDNLLRDGYRCHTRIIDDACVPMRAIFQYDVSCPAGYAATISGALGGLHRLIRTLVEAHDAPAREIIEQAAFEGIRLILQGMQRISADERNALNDPAVRAMLGYGTDLSGYMPMLDRRGE